MVKTVCGGTVTDAVVRASEVVTVDAAGSVVVWDAAVGTVVIVAGLEALQAAKVSRVAVAIAAEQKRSKAFIDSPLNAR